MSVDHLSSTFAALADPTRRAILARLSAGETSVKELCEPFEMSPPAVSKHLKVLERAGLISRSRDAQWRPCRLEAARLEEVANWVEQYKSFWNQSLDRLDAYLMEFQKKEKSVDGKNNAATSTADRELIATRIVDAPAELTFKMFTDPEHIVHWWGPDGFTTTISTMDVVAGGQWKFVMHGPDGIDYPNENRYLEVVKPKRLVYAHLNPPQHQVTITFTEKNGKTELNFHMVFETKDLFESTVKAFKADQGLNQTLNRLLEKVSTYDGTISTREPAVFYTRQLKAPRELVFKAWTDPKHLQRWWGPAGFTNPVCEVDAKEGGLIQIHMMGPNGTVYPMTGTYIQIVEPELIVFTSSALDASGNKMFDVLNTVTFKEQGNHTILTLHARVTRSTSQAVHHIQGMEEGWRQSLVRLVEYCTKM